MYKVYSDSFLIYSDTINTLKINEAKLELEVNKTGAFEFEIYPDHPYYNNIEKLKSIITVYQDDFLLFRGRVLDDEDGFYNQKHVICEGELAFLFDSIQRPYDFSGSITDFLTMLITAHNSQVEEEKQFVVGNVTVVDANDTIARSDIEYTNTFEVIEKKLIELLGGYIIIRHEDGVNYIDYLSDFTQLSSQRVEFARNLLELKKIKQGADICTALIPLGAKITNSDGQETDVRLTIATVNGESDFIYDADAVAQYGWIFTTHIWEDVTEAENLLSKGKVYLATLINPFQSLELTAADLATIDSTVTSFHIGTYVRVVSKPHGIEQNMLVSKLSIDLLDPIANKLVLGGILESFTEQEVKKSTSQAETIKVINQNVTDASSQIYQTEQNLQSSISATATNIISKVEENYYLKEETDSIVSSVSTELTQTKEMFQIEFTQFETDINALATGTDAQFEEIKKYIRFIDGNIVLGEDGNTLTLQIENDKITFLDSGTEVAYFSNNKLYVTDGTFINSLQLGNYAFIPRDNGNLSFKKNK